MANMTLQEAFEKFKAAAREAAEKKVERNDAEKRAKEAVDADRAAATKMDNARQVLGQVITRLAEAAE